MRVLAIGDVHGCARALEELLIAVEPRPGDRLVFLGDYIDRGPDSWKVIETIFRMRRLCEVVCLMGNHELMLLEARMNPAARAAWLQYGGAAMLESYVRRGCKPGLMNLPPAHQRFFGQELVPYHETETHIFVHASVDPLLELAAQPETQLFWERFTPELWHHSGRTVVCGHTSQKEGWPVLAQGGVCVDTFVYGGGWLTCLDTGAETFTQASERGEIRRGRLADLA